MANEELKILIKQKAQDYKESVIEIRRHLHKNPELSFQEFNTLENILNYHGKLKLSLYNTMGQLIYQNKQQNRPRIKQGIYLLRINNAPAQLKYFSE